MKRQNGITLIALIITVIVLLILAAVFLAKISLIESILLFLAFKLNVLFSNTHNKFLSASSLNFSSDNFSQLNSSLILMFKFLHKYARIE